MRLLPAGIIALVLGCALSAFAQKNEIAVTAGGYFPTGTSIDIVPAAVIEGSYARRILGVPLASLYVEVPVAKTFDIGLFSNAANFSALFVAPGVKLKVAPGFFVSPWLAIGGGVAHFSASTNITGSHLSATSNTGVVDFGGGIDMKIAPFVSFRVEARDYYSGSLSTLLPVALPVSILPGRQNNLLATGGFVIRF